MSVLKWNERGLGLWVASAGNSIEESRGGGSQKVMKTSKAWISNERYHCILNSVMNLKSVFVGT